MRLTVEVDLALTRPPKVDKTTRVVLDSCCAHHGELQAISAAVQVHGAVMPLGSVIIDWA